MIHISLGTIYEPIDHIVIRITNSQKQPKKGKTNIRTISLLMERRDEHYSNYFVQSPSSGFHDPESEFQSPTRSDTTPLVISSVNEFPMYSDFLKYSEINFLYEDDKKMPMSSQTSNSGWSIVLQIGWRFLFSFGVALLVFYIATQPPRPNISLQVISIF